MSIFKEYKKFSIIFFILIALFIIWRIFIYEAPFRVIEEDDFTSGQQYLDYYKRLEKEYAKDNIGSTTPEGTLQEFITALKAGDTELASKYFVIEKQEKMAEDLKRWSENGGNDYLLSYLEKADSGTENSKGYYTMSIPTDDDTAMYVNFIQNNSSMKWKIVKF